MEEMLNPDDDLLKKGGIFNLSSHVITWEEYKVLQRGLSYCPTSDMDLFEVFLDLNEYVRKLTLKQFFQIKNKKESVPVFSLEMNQKITNMIFKEPDDLTEELLNSPIPSGLKNPSKFYPTQSCGNFLETFYELVLKDLRGLNKRNNEEKNGKNYNLTKKEKRAI